MNQNLTSYESTALDGLFNLSDGHPRQRPTAAQAAIFARLGEIFAEATRYSFEDIEALSQQRFFEAVGQRSAPIGEGRILSCYSSSVAMDIFARALRARTERVALIHPTFDNIPDLLRARGNSLVPVSEDALDAHSDSVFGDPSAGCLFVTTPNNPTGWVASEDTLEWLAERCRDRHMLLALDTSFRGFDPRSWYDTYEVLDASGVEYVVLEDTGKLWPAQELKAGFLVQGSREIPLREAFSDVLLTLSPVILAMIAELATEAAEGGFQQLHQLIARNRQLVRSTLGEVDIPASPDAGSRVSVERVLLPAGLDADEVYTELVKLGVHILPCGSFHWARPQDGRSFIRISLARDTDMLREAMWRIMPWLAQASGRADQALEEEFAA